MITTVLLDFYNTLYAEHDWFELEVRGLPVAILRHLESDGTRFTPSQIESPRREYRRVRGEVESRGFEVSAEECVAHALQGAQIDVPGNLSELVERLISESYRPGCELPGAVECVRQLATEGYTLGIVSNALSTSFIRMSLGRSGIEDCFSGIFGSAEVGYYKSSPRLYEEALRSLGSQPEHTVMVRDNWKYDIQAAKAAGLRTVWYSSDGSRPVGDEADMVIRQLTQLPCELTKLQSSGAPSKRRYTV